MNEWLFTEEVQYYYSIYHYSDYCRLLLYSIHKHTQTCIHTCLQCSTLALGAGASVVSGHHTDVVHLPTAQICQAAGGAIG